MTLILYKLWSILNLWIKLKTFAIDIIDNQGNTCTLPSVNIYHLLFSSLDKSNCSSDETKYRNDTT